MNLWTITKNINILAAQYTKEAILHILIQLLRVHIRTCIICIFNLINFCKGMAVLWVGSKHIILS